MRQFDRRLGLLGGISLVSLLIILAMLLTGRYLSGYFLACTGYAVFLLLNEGSVRKQRRLAAREAKEIDLFLSEVRHRYYVHGMADEAVFDASELVTERSMKKKAEQLCDVLRSEEPQGAAEQYRQKEKNRYLKLFLTLCLTVMEYGDRTINGQSMFLNNLLNLKDELRREQVQETELWRKTAGIALIAAAPAFVLSVIERWGTENLPELTAFYQSSAGVTIAALLFTVSVATYLFVNLLRNGNRQDETVQELLQTTEQKRKIHRMLGKLMYQFPVWRSYATKLLLETGDWITPCQLLLQKLLLGGAVLVVLLCDRVYREFAGLTGIHPLFIIGCALLAFFVPDCCLLLRRQMMRMHMEEEVMQYQSIIIMLMYVEKIAVYEILEVLEQFAFIFRRSISDCLNEYHSGDTEALENLRMKEGCEPFRTLCDKFLMCDRIGVRRAFDEISADREYYQKQQEQEAEFLLQRKVLLGQFIAFLPLILTIGGYLIIPFAKESLSMLTAIYEDMQL